MDTTPSWRATCEYRVHVLVRLCVIACMRVLHVRVCVSP